MNYTVVVSKPPIREKTYELCLHFFGPSNQLKTLITKYYPSLSFLKISNPGDMSCPLKNWCLVPVSVFDLTCWQRHQTFSAEQISSSRKYLYQTEVSGKSMR